MSVLYSIHLTPHPNSYARVHIRGEEGVVGVEDRPGARAQALSKHCIEEGVQCKSPLFLK